MLDLEQQIFKQLEKAQHILISFPADNNGDALASGLALFLFLKKLGKEVEISNSAATAAKHPLSFLPNYSEIQENLSNLRRFIVSLNISQAKVSQIKYAVDKDQLNFIISPTEGWFKPEDVTARAGEFRYDLIVSLGATDLESLGEIYDNNVEFFYKTAIINIDHHATNEEFGQVNFVDLNAVATAEILCYLLKNYKPELIDEDIATCLLAGIIQETRNFKTPNLTPRTLLTTSQLISLGARREEIVSHLYRSRDLNSLKAWGKVLNSLRAEEKLGLFWSKLSLADSQNFSATGSDLNDIVDELIANIPSGRLAIIFSEEAPGKTRVFAYSLKNINLLDFLKEYTPQGNAKSASFSLAQDMDTAEIELISDLKNKLEKINL